MYSGGQTLFERTPLNELLTNQLIKIWEMVANFRFW